MEIDMTQKFEVRSRFYAFSDKYDVIMITFSLAEAEEYKRLFEGCEKYKQCDIYIKQVR